MKITFFANYLNPHTIHLCNALYSKLAKDFTFVSSLNMEDERIKLGWNNNVKVPYEIDITQNVESYERANQLAIESDIIIHGSAPAMFVNERIKHNKLIFRHFERINKKGRWTLLLPPRLLSVLRRYVIYGNKNVYILCASAYTAGDFALLNAYKGKTYKWGYFPEVKKYDMKALFQKKDHEQIELLWVGRFINWKHPEKAIYIARRLKDDGYKFNLKMIGTGKKENNIKKLIQKYNLSDCVKLLGTMPPEKVREYMESANIYLFTSDYQEGWGAVLNEAMNSGCGVVASHAVGSTPFLIKHDENGLIYKNRDNKNLYEQVKKLMDSKELCERLGKSAYLAISEKWSAENAAERFIELCEKKLKDNSYPGEIGTEPCNIAAPIPQGKIYSSIIKGKDI